MSGILHEKLTTLANSSEPSFSGALQSACAAVCGNADRSANSAAITLAQFEARETMMTAGSAMSWMDGPGLATIAKATRCPTGANFDGTNDYMTRGGTLTGAADASGGTISAVLTFAAGGDGVRQRILNAANASVIFERTAAARFQMFVTNDGGTITYTISNNTAISSANGCVHIVMSWDANAAAGAKPEHVYLNGVSDKGTITDAGVAFNVDYTATDWGIGARASDGADKLNAELAELWFNPTYIDLSIAANLRKFVTPSGNRADLLSDGSGPTGSAPLLYVRGPAATMNVNLGSGGNFSITGALTDGSVITRCGE